MLEVGCGFVDGLLEIGLHGLNLVVGLVLVVKFRDLTHELSSSDVDFLQFLRGNLGCVRRAGSFLFGLSIMDLVRDIALLRDLDSGGRSDDSGRRLRGGSLGSWLGLSLCRGSRLSLGSGGGPGWRSLGRSSLGRSGLGRSSLSRGSWGSRGRVSFGLGSSRRGVRLSLLAFLTVSDAFINFL